tara:strand:- start:9518 stop:10024 length:507 start_codon:yes stop_codon:yes gene_type:complete
MDNTIFPGATDAIHWSIRRLNSPIIKPPSMNSMSKKTAAFEYMPMLNPWEKLAEAVLIWKAVGRVCTPEECLTLSIYYLGGSNAATEILVKKLARELGRDRYFVMDTVRTWARERPHHSCTWWGKKYGVSSSTANRWQQEITDRLEVLLRSAITGATIGLKESGHVAD